MKGEVEVNIGCMGKIELCTKLFSLVSMTHLQGLLVRLKMAACYPHQQNTLGPEPCITSPVLRKPRAPGLGLQVEWSC